MVFSGLSEKAARPPSLSFRDPFEMATLSVGHFQVQTDLEWTRQYRLIFLPNDQDHGGRDAFNPLLFA